MNTAANPSAQTSPVPPADVVIVDPYEFACELCERFGRPPGIDAAGVMELLVRDWTTGLSIPGLRARKRNEPFPLSERAVRAIFTAHTSPELRGMLRRAGRAWDRFFELAAHAAPLLGSACLARNAVAVRRVRNYRPRRNSWKRRP